MDKKVKEMAKKILNKVGIKGRKDEQGKEQPAFYGRSVKGGGMNIKQLVTPKHVISLSKNSSGSNGDVHGWKVGHKKRKETNL